MADNNIITFKNFSKSFGSVKAVDNLSFEVNKGEVFAFLGANGSGKTTTIRCLLRIYSPDKGSLLINGKEYDQSMSSILGYIPEERGLYSSSKVIDTLVYFATLKGVPQEKARRKSYEYLERVGLSEKTESEIKTLSSGQQQKIQHGIAIINEPELLILDEPTRGLDPVNRSLLMEIINELNEKGSTVVYTSHQMEDVEKIADRLIMINDGKKVLYGELDKVKKEFGTNTINIRFSGKLPSNKKLYTTKQTKNTAEITPAKNVKPEQILKYLLNKNVDIHRYAVGAPSLEEIFINVIKKNDKKH